MPILRRARGAQWPLVQEYVFNYTDGVAPVASLGAPGNELLFKLPVVDLGSGVQPTGMLSGQTWSSGVGLTSYFDVLSLPPGAQIIGGDAQIEVPYAGPATATLSLGDIHSGNILLNAMNLKATAFTNQPTTITNAGSDPTVMTLGNATANGVTAVGQTITVTGCTGASAAYNGTFLVDSFSATQVVVTNPALTTSLTLAGTPNATFITGRTALSIPDEITGGYNVWSPVAGQPLANEFAAGYDIRATLALGAGAATQGRVRVRVLFTIDGRMNEVYQS